MRFLAFAFAVEVASQPLVVSGNDGVISDTTVDAGLSSRCGEEFLASDDRVFRMGCHHRNHQKDWEEQARPELAVLELAVLTELHRP